MTTFAELFPVVVESTSQADLAVAMAKHRVECRLWTAEYVGRILATAAADPRLTDICGYWAINAVHNWMVTPFALSTGLPSHDLFTDRFPGDIPRDLTSDEVYELVTNYGE